MASPTRTPLPRWFCKAHATCLPTPDDHGNLLNRKAHVPRGSAEGRPRANMAVLMGSQLLVGWHVLLRLTAHIVMTSQDGTVAEHGLAVPRCGGWWRGSSAHVLTTANASSTYVWTRAGMPPPRRVRAAT